MSLATVTTRQQALDLLEGYAEERKDELDQQKSRRPLVKSYMLETVPQHRAEPDLKAVLAAAGHALTPLDETLFKIRDNAKGKTVGLLENLLPRHPVIYTCEESKEMDPWVRSLVNSIAATASRTTDSTLASCCESTRRPLRPQSKPRGRASRRLAW